LCSVALFSTWRRGRNPPCRICVGFDATGRETSPLCLRGFSNTSGERNPPCRTYVGFDAIGRETSSLPLCGFLMRRRGATLSFVSGLFFQHGGGEILPVVGFDATGRETCLGCLIRLQNFAFFWCHVLTCFCYLFIYGAYLLACTFTTTWCTYDMLSLSVALTN
jgi:hypothetical protein